MDGTKSVIMELKVGDVVQLNSGGPKMTVSQYPFKTIDGAIHEDQVECTWFDSENRLKHNVFNVKQLQKSDLL